MNEVYIERKAEVLIEKGAADVALNNIRCRVEL